MPKIGVFAGTFNPFHIGHKNILEQAEKMFDKVIIAVGKNKSKQGSAHINELRSKLPRHQIDYYSGFLTDYLRCKDYDVTLIRGLRNGQDLQYEQNMRSTIKDLDKDVKIVYYLCDSAVEHISSSMVKEIQAINPAAAEQYLAI